jgi:hypothetical protein
MTQETSLIHNPSKLLSYPKLGYYVYKNVIWERRQDIADEMMITKTFNEPVKFWYNDDVFSQLDWTQEPDISLDDLYVQRAKQLREEYDYIILSYSGGSDSNEILEICLNNNIFIDEVQVYNYEKCIERIDPLALLLDRNLSIFLDYQRAVIPDLKRLCLRSPNTKITVIDVSDDFMADIYKNNFDFIRMDKQFGKTSVHGTLVRLGSGYIHHYNAKHFKCSKNKVAFIRGFEKPLFNMKNGELIFHFSDILLNGVNHVRYHNWNMYTIENFFWTADSPLIPLKQSHVLKRAFEQNPAYYSDLVSWIQNRNSHKWKVIPSFVKEYGFDRTFIPYIYKYWPTNKFNSRKPVTSPDMKLASIHLKNANPYRASAEQAKYISRAYNGVPLTVINKKMISKGYSLGKMHVSRNKYDLIGV